MRRTQRRGPARPRREPYRPLAPNDVAWRLCLYAQRLHPHPQRLCLLATTWLLALATWLAPQRGLAQAPTPAEPERGGLACTPDVPAIQTRRPIPFECHGDGETARISIRYREHPDAPWRTLELARHEDGFRATLPCDVTMNSGRLAFFVVASDRSGDPVDTLGSKNAPLTLVLDPRSSVAPAYPGEEPPDRCEEQVLCPPEFPGCDDPEAAAERARRFRPQAAPRHWFGLHVAADLGFHGGSNVCTANNPDYDCFLSGRDTPFPGLLGENVARVPGEVGDGYPGTDIDSSLALGTLRLLLAYDHTLTERVSLGGRLGFAIGGSPTTLEGESFLPVHAEARLTFWPGGQWQPGIHPYLSFGGGFAEVDLKKSGVQVRDCTDETGRQLFLDCIAATNGYAPEANPDLPVRELDAYRRLGKAFVAAGGGLLVPLGSTTALQLNLNAMLMLPSVGLVLEPSLGVVYGL